MRVCLDLVTEALTDRGIHRLVDHLQTGTVAELQYAARGVLRPGIGGIRREEEFEAAEESVGLAATIWWNAREWLVEQPKKALAGFPELTH